MDSKTVGILGGGQLGRMMVECANRLNIKTVVLDIDNSPAKQINSNIDHVNGSFNDLKLIDELAKKCDLLTIEIEHVNVNFLKEVSEKYNIPVYPSCETIRLIQDKYCQKCHLKKNHIKTVDFLPVLKNELPELEKIGKILNYPFLLKSRTLGYDGRGNFFVKCKDSLISAIDFFKDKKLYAERNCCFIKELSVIVVKTLKNEIFHYPVVETKHEDSICKIVYAVARIKQSLIIKATELAIKTIESFDGCGVFGVEMFLMSNDDIFINEISPRTHNSGHYTIDSCKISQFEAHIRVITGLPLPSDFTDFKSNDMSVIMYNVLGDEDEKNKELKICQKAMFFSDCYVHLYGKESKPKRKIGHINIVCTSSLRCDDILNQLIQEKECAVKLDVSKTVDVGIIMGSDSDLEVMSKSADILSQFNVTYELTIVSAHRTPDRMYEYANTAKERGLKVIIAGAGGAAHLPGMIASMTTLPVIGVPIKTSFLDGLDSLYSIVQMPRGIPVATVAINNSTNASLLALRILAIHNPFLSMKIRNYKNQIESEVHTKIKNLEIEGYESYLKSLKP